MMEFYSETCQTARKEHFCEMCGKKIKPGETYFRENGKWNGDFFSRANGMLNKDAAMKFLKKEEEHAGGA